MNKKILLFCLIPVLLFGKDVEEYGLTKFSQKIQKSKIEVELNRFKQSSKHVCFDEYYDIQKSISFRLNIDGNNVLIPPALYCFMLDLKQMNLLYKNNLFVLEGFGGDGIASYNFEVYFDKKNILKVYGFGQPSKKDTTVQILFKPLILD